MTPLDRARDAEKAAEQEGRRATETVARATRLLTVFAAAERCGVTTRTILNWIKSGVILGVPLPPGRGKQKRRHHRIPASEVEKIATHHR